MNRVKQLPNGVWPTMITPFTENNEIDYASLGKLIDWYIERGVDGLFAVCQSSEMFKLSLEERVALAAFTVERSAGRVPVIASGHISDAMEDQIYELQAISKTGIAALVLITNRLASEDESDEVLKNRLEELLQHLPKELPLGFYECPAPYKRLMTPELLRWCADTGRFQFLKDTSCDVEEIRAKVEAVSGTGLKLYNANSATLLETLKLGAAGYSGVMANFHPELYVWLVKNFQQFPAEAQLLSDQLSLASFIERQVYPVNAKYHMMLEQVSSNYLSRTRDASQFHATNRLEVEQLHRLAKHWRSQFPGV
ncbi:dihydrodipicolinate synthase family protein [Paenibacillus sp. IITD108]|uniref:dihydrodipicolinate synthase family protein n=1 Tax=Paenibacillus sp. IITD108 TaxID=3116649 RepID=UPI002F401CF3